ncbi:prolyl-tRNA synthetase associated domain-containing protein [Sphingomonas sanguinis]|uniref:Prolyl-tRNA synthetase associated domain-containing protein n=1 Tax=Sphingomonas sanguinis TaxID=33051 RepID=A0ABU5LQ07_9SPHN|nr:prolyl-tRNA synthetase associated domain-containing protein [Sphingomonas sanguinis]MDZ7281801.1 prolyl-tRNA synthetase associated domain-containing protein [Sphingomonas sanguinis]QXT35560.1 prolyl-tRNA synthetase associated domain-containing protein [Sphingomonas sanguinis]
MTEDELYAELDRAGIAVEKLEHPPVFTVDESAAIHAALPAAHTKNLFLKDKHKNLWLVVLPSDRRADLKAYAELLGAGKFSFGKAEEMEQVLGVSPGAVTPLAIVNAAPGAVSLVFDAAFEQAERIAVHPLRNTATVALPFAALVPWLEARGHAVRVIALP